MFTAVSNPYLVPFDGTFKQSRASTRPPQGAPDKKTCKKRLAEYLVALEELQRRLYAHDYQAVLLIFQAMDAAGKDGTIRAVLSGMDPAGCQVYSFKQPSAEELNHDFLWRTTCRLPERGKIGVFNRSYYEEVLIVRVHPEYLNWQKLPQDDDREKLWQHRYQSIRDHELHLARNGTVIIKFWLHVSAEEQRRRFLKRLRQPEKHWKFSAADINERAFWNEYMQAYEAALNETSRPWAPWYRVPADDKAFMRLTVAEILVESLRTMDLYYPQAQGVNLAEVRQVLQQEENP